MTETEVTKEEYVIRKGSYYYRPNAQGYTSSINTAGRFSLEEAILHSYPNGPDGPRDSIDYMPAPVRTQTAAGFQAEVSQWMTVCFGETIKADKVERCDRFIEEALEFVQAVGYSADRAHALVDYVFGRAVGEVSQEVGGVMVTLAAACNTVGVDIGEAARTELARVWTKVEAIRAKQAAKPTGSALPIATQSAAQNVPVLLEALKQIQRETTAVTPDLENMEICIGTINSHVTKVLGAQAAPIARYRHVKRGTVYEVIGEAELQMSVDCLVDGSSMVVYRGEDGRLWCREEGEFHDGRFEAITQAQEPE